MSTTWIEVADTALKIGLGAMITAVSGYLMLKRNQNHELEKERRARFYDLQEQKKKIYVDFLSKSEALVQSYLSSTFCGDTEDYKEYLTSFNQVQIMSEDEIRIAAYNLLSSVNVFICSNKNTPDYDDLKAYRTDVNAKVGFFQKVVQVEVTREYESA
ncbi:hypothetical protein A6E01_18240 [Vibrio breoganii]|uniref:DUF4760 domain-containing protein n=1 Tax=Vibrio breoganii TaxID=553239 RepID=A0AAN0XYH3_9VIBR|nr:hypothetical protein [Vibrio breoganii]ANO35112.1 hypothetical protein A6E01_18240 [Vibrio breoganii]PMI19365.1 hypothetical protein BCU49_09775 [Vibrio breoganii]